MKIEEALEKRILVLDGGMGTMIQREELVEEDFRGAEFSASAVPLKGCNDVLVLTAPHVIEKIHEAYLAAGADIISTDTFNANAISLADYGIQGEVRRINREAAQLARRVAGRFTAAEPGKPRFVAGSVGPTNRMASMPSDFLDLAARAITFDELAAAYVEQMRGLVEGGADLLLIETAFDTLNAKAAIYAVSRIRKEFSAEIPVVVSGTLTDSGRTLSAQTVEAFYLSVAHARPLAVGLNCGFGARQLHPFLARLAAVAECRISVHPNAGLPNAAGGYDETSETFAAEMEEYLREGLLNMVGGCCGTTPEHIAALAARVDRHAPHPFSALRDEATLCGLEPLRIEGEMKVSHKLNVAKNQEFAEMLRGGRYEEALALAGSEISGGAQLLNIWVEDGTEGSSPAETMTKLLNTLTFDPEVARVPFIIGSSEWPAVEAGLKCLQGRSLVHPRALGEEKTEYLRRREIALQYGAVVPYC